VSNVRATADTDPRITGGVTQIPNALLRSPHLCMEEKLLYGVLYSHLWQPDSVVVTQRLLAYETATSERQIRRWLNRLEDLGLVRIIQPGLQKPNIYELPPIPHKLLAIAPHPDRSETSGPERTELDRSEMAGQDRSQRSRVSGPGRSETADKQSTSGNSAALPSEDKPMEVTPASGSGSETKTIEAGASSARTQARVNSARVKAQPNPDVRPMLQRHAQCYQDKVGAPYPISWAKEGAIVKRLLATYSRDELVLLQDTFFAQKADSQSALRGYTVQWLEHEAPALMARIQLQNGLTAEQREVIAALVAEGVTEPTATALASEYRVEDIRRQLHAHAVRKDRLRSPAAALVKAIREGWQVPEESEPDYYRPLRLAAASDGTPVGPPPEEIRVQLERTIAHLVGR